MVFIPLYYFCYLVGVFILGEPTDVSGQVIHMDMAKLIDDIFAGELDNLSTFFFTSGVQLLFGCLVVGLISGAISYVAVNYLWRLHVLKHWKERHLKRKTRKENN